MIEQLISTNINKLNTDIINNFLLSNNIFLNNNELSFLYDFIKIKWKDLLYNENYLQLIKDKIRPYEYDKLNNLYHIYKDKYKYYL